MAADGRLPWPPSAVGFAGTAWVEPFAGFGVALGQTVGRGVT